MVSLVGLRFGKRKGMLIRASDVHLRRLKTLPLDQAKRQKITFHAWEGSDAMLENPESRTLIKKTTSWQSSYSVVNLEHLAAGTSSQLLVICTIKVD